MEAAARRGCWLWSRTNPASMRGDPSERVRRPWAVRLARDVAGAEMIAAGEYDPLDVAARGAQRLLHQFGLARQMREIVAAVRNQERRRRPLDIANGTGRRVMAGIRRPQKARAHRKSGAFAEIVHARHRQASAHHIARKTPTLLPIAPDCKQSGVMTAGGMAADEDAPRVTAIAADVSNEPCDRIGDVVVAGRKQMLRREPIADAREDDPSLVENRRHEEQMLLVTADPSAAVRHRDHAAVGLLRNA